MGKKQSDVYNHLAGERSIFGIHLSTSFTAEWLHITDSLLEATGIAAAEYWCFCDKSCHNKYVFKLNIRCKGTKNALIIFHFGRKSS
jgi:hypothetical protein